MRGIKEVFDATRDELRKQGILEIVNLIDPDAKLHKLHVMFGFTKVHNWRGLDVYQIHC